MTQHYIGLMAGYATAAAVVWALWAAKAPFLRLELPTVRRPWLELGLLALATAAVIAIGQAYSAGLMFDNDQPALESLNQLLIFSPILAVQALRPKPLATAGLQPKGAPGLALGAVLALERWRPTWRRRAGSWSTPPCSDSWPALITSPSPCRSSSRTSR